VKDKLAMTTITTPKNVTVTVTAKDGKVRVAVKDASLANSVGLNFPLDAASAVKLIDALDAAVLEAEKQN
jgi:hypothetical protein